MNHPSNSSSSPSPSSSLPTNLLVFIIILVVIELLILIGNGFVVYLVITRKRLHTNTNWIVLSLAVSDLAVSFAIVPSRIICFFYKCDEILMKILYDIFIFVSLCNLCCLTLDRLVAVMKPLQYPTLITHSTVKKMITINWVLPTVVFCIPIVWTYGYSNDLLLRQTADKIFYLTQIILFMCVPCLVMFAVYAYILRLALDQARRIKHLEKSVTRRPSPSYSTEASSTIKVFGLVYFLFVFCWIISAYRTFTTFFQLGKVRPEVTMTSRLLLIFNSCVNPIVYALWKKDFRSEMSKMFCRGRRQQVVRGHVMGTRARGSANPALEDGASTSGSDYQETNISGLSIDGLTDKPLNSQGNDRTITDKQWNSQGNGTSGGGVNRGPRPYAPGRNHTEHKGRNNNRQTTSRTRTKTPDTRRDTRRV